MEVKHYKAHKSSIFNCSARLLLIITIILGVLINMVSTLYVLGWVPALIIFYLEKKSIFVKYHSLLVVLLEVIKGSVLLLLTMISLQLDLPYFYGIYTDTNFELGIMAYMDIAINAMFLVIRIYQIWKICNYSELNIKLINKIIYYFMKKDPKFYEMENKMVEIEK